MRNLTKDETKKILTLFGKALQDLKINNKPLVIGSDAEVIALNKELTLDEIKSQYPVKEDNILAVIRQLYLRLTPALIRKEIGEDIINLPTVSFLERNGIIQLNY